MGVDASESGCMGRWRKAPESENEEKRARLGCLGFRREKENTSKITEEVKEEKEEGKTAVEDGAVQKPALEAKEESVPVEKEEKGKEEKGEKEEKPLPPRSSSLLQSVSKGVVRAIRSLSSKSPGKPKAVKAGDVAREETKEEEGKGGEVVKGEEVKEEKEVLVGVEGESPPSKLEAVPQQVESNTKTSEAETPTVDAHEASTLATSAVATDKSTTMEPEKVPHGNKMLSGDVTWAPGSALARHNVTVLGSGSELLFMSHGFGTNQQIWGPLLEAFDLQTKYKVVLWDLMGAYSTNPEGFDFQRYSTLHGYADDLLEVLDELEIQEITYVGHSVSGMVGVIASTERPQVFKRLILIGASSRYLDMPGYKGGFTLEMLDQVFAAMQDNYKAWASGFAPMVVGEDVDSVAVREFCRSLFLIRPDIAFSTLKTIFTCDLRYILPQVTKQVHLLQTARDAAVPWEPVQYMLDHLPNACVEMIPVAGHLPHLTHPKIVADAVLRHLDMPIRPLPSARLQDDSFRSGHSLISGQESGRLGSGELQPMESFEDY